MPGCGRYTHLLEKLDKNIAGHEDWARNITHPKWARNIKYIGVHMYIYIYIYISIYVYMYMYIHIYTHIREEYEHVNLRQVRAPPGEAGQKHLGA